MLIRFTTPCFLGTTEYASGAEADLPPDVANMALSLGCGVRILCEAEAAPAAPELRPEPQPQPASPVADLATDDGATRAKRC